MGEENNNYIKGYVRQKNDHPISFDTEGNLVDQVSGEKGTMMLPELTVRGVNPKTRARNYSSAYHPEDSLEFFDIMTRPLTRPFSISQQIGAIRNKINGGTYWGSLLGNEENLGVVSKNFNKENPYLSIITNIGADVVTPGISKLTKFIPIKYKIPKNLKVTNNLSSHLQGEEAVKMFKQYGGIKIPEGNINGEQLRKYVQEARIRYGLVSNKNITDEEIAESLYKHVLELGKGSAAKNIQGEPQLLFRGDTKRYTELKPRPTPEELKNMGGTMDNSLGNLFLGQMPESMGGLERYIVHVQNFGDNMRVIGSGTGSKAVLPNGNVVKEFTNDVIGTIPEGSYQLYSYPYKYGNISAYKLPASWSESGVNDINAFVVKTPNMRNASKEISVLNDDFIFQGGSKVDYYGPIRRKILDKDGFPQIVDETGKIVGDGLSGSSDRSAMAKHYQQVLNKAKNEQQGLLKSDKNSLLRDEHDNYDYFALPNFNIRGAKHILPYDLRIPRDWNSSNIYKAFIPIGIATYGFKNN